MNRIDRQGRPPPAAPPAQVLTALQAIYDITNVALQALSLNSHVPEEGAAGSDEDDKPIVRLSSTEDDFDENEPIFLVAVQNQDPISLDMLLKSEFYLPAHIGEAILIATENGDVECLSRLLETGVYPYDDLQEAKRIAVQNQDHKCLSLLTKTT